MVVVAEGIEDEETAVLLYEAGCDIGQGFHLAKPVPSDAITKMLHRQFARPQSVGVLVEAAKA